VKKNGSESVNVDHGDSKGFVLLCGCPRAKYEDMHPLPDTITSWSYKIIYTKGGVEMVYSQFYLPLLYSAACLVSQRIYCNRTYYSKSL